MTLPDGATLLADPTQVPTSLTREQAEILAVDTVAALLGDTTKQNWEAASEVLARLTPSAGASDVFFVMARIWRRHRPSTATAPPRVQVMDAIASIVAMRGLYGNAERNAPHYDEAVAARTRALEQAAADLLETPSGIPHADVTGFTSPADLDEATALAAAIIARAHTRVNRPEDVTLILDAITEVHASGVLVALTRLHATLDRTPIGFRPIRVTVGNHLGDTRR